MKPAKRKGVIYARYSSHNQKEESIEQQVAECTEFAQANQIDIIQVYADKAVSGKTDKRTQFQRMMRDANRREFTVVIAYKSNRIARNMLNALSYEDKLSKFGIETLYAKEEFGNTAAGRFALRTMMNVNQFYSENLAEDVRRGMADNAANCKVNGSLPFGYCKGPDGKFAISPPEAKVVRYIYEQVLNDVPLAEISAVLNSKGIKTKMGAQWNKNSYHRLLTNDAYIGVYRHSGHVIENGVPAILPKEVFFQVQEKLENRSKTTKYRRTEFGTYLLTGKLFCGRCGSSMVGVSGTGRNGTKHFYYTCTKKLADKSCKKKNVRRDWIEHAVADAVRTFILRDDVIEWIADSAVDVVKQSSRTSEIRAMEEQLAENRKAVKNILSAIEQGIFTVSTKDRLLELEEDIANIEKSIEMAKLMSKSFDRNQFVYALEQFRECDIDNKADQKHLIDAFVKAVYLYDDDLRIDFYYAGNKNSVSVALESADKGSGDFSGSGSYCFPSGSPIPPIFLENLGVLFYQSYFFW